MHLIFWRFAGLAAPVGPLVAIMKTCAMTTKNLLVRAGAAGRVREHCDANPLPFLDKMTLGALEQLRFGTSSFWDSVFQFDVGLVWVMLGSGGAS